ncbi:MAG: hypothetical protein E7254_02045 [Lachnospiraceae bacterium]|nr:hypothetical protein [Lachnospiraceae bacterium]
MRRIFNKMISGVMTLTMVAGLLAGTPGFATTVSAGTEIQLKPWLFYEGGESNRSVDPNGYPMRFYNSVTLFDSEGEELASKGYEDYWYVGPHTAYMDGPEVTWNSDGIVANAFEADINTTGWDAEWAVVEEGKEAEPVADNPFFLRAEMNEINILPGHIYTVSFSAKWENDAAAPVKNVLVTLTNEAGDSVFPEDADTHMVIKNSTSKEEKIENFSQTFKSNDNSVVDLKLGYGAFLYTYNKIQAENEANGTHTPAENVSAAGWLNIKDFKIVDEGIDPDYNPIVPIVTNFTGEAYKAPTGNKEGKRYADNAVVSSGCSWAGFSVCTMEDHVDGDDLTHVVKLAPTDPDYNKYANHEKIEFVKNKPQDKHCWRHSLEANYIEDTENPGMMKLMQYGVDFATEGEMVKQNSQNFVFDVKNSGWDGEYDRISGDLVGNNPWGLKAYMEGIKGEAGRTYTVEFDIQSTIAKSDLSVKHVLVKPHQIGFGDAAFDFTSVSGIGKDGMIALDARTGKKHVKATFTVPENYRDTGKGMGFMFAFGAFLKDYPDEIAMSGQLAVTNFTVKANHQCAVKFVNGSSVKTVYVNPGKTVKDGGSDAKKGYNFLGWYNGNTKYNFNSAVTKDLTLTAKWAKVKKPGKAKLKKVKSNKSKKLTVTIKKVKGAAGYKIYYSTDKKFKKKKTKSKTTTKTTYTISKLKSGVKYYVRVKAYSEDSIGNEYLSKKYSNVKSAYVN